MEQNYDSATLTPKHIVDAFQSAYRQVYGREAQVVHMFAEWYTVNGETVHRRTLFSEISRLAGLAREQQAIIAQKQQEEFVQQMWYAEQQAQAQYEHEQLMQQQFATQQAGLAPQPEAQFSPPQRQLAKPNAERSMIQRLISRLRGS
jgi:hypothetical protein